MTASTLTLGDAEVPRIGLGTNRLSHTPEHVSFIRDAVAAGIGHIDTAYLYAGGESEATIGAALSTGSNGAVVATKGGYRPGEGRPDVLRAQIDESLRRLRADAITLYYLHRVDPETPFEDTVGALKDARDTGKILHVGLSEVSVDQIERARRVVPVAAVQNHYNLTERKHEDVVDYCAREAIVFVPYFPLRGGTPAAVNEIASAHDATPSQVILAWLVRRSPTTFPIPGSLNVAHVRENLAALDIELSDEEVSALHA